LLVLTACLSAREGPPREFLCEPTSEHTERNTTMALSGGQ
jgi:hypothetical protein